jgi:DNA polymerase-4
VADDLQRKGYQGKTIGIKLRYDDFKGVTRDLTIEEPTADAQQIRRAAGLCLKRAPLTQRLRLLGVRVGALEKTIAEDESKENGSLAHTNKAPKAIDSIATDGQLF